MKLQWGIYQVIFKVNIIDFLVKCSTLLTHLGVATWSLGSQDMSHRVNLSVTAGVAASVQTQVLSPAGFKDHYNETKQELEEFYIFHLRRPL